MQPSALFRKPFHSGRTEKQEQQINSCWPLRVRLCLWTVIPVCPSLPYWFATGRSMLPLTQVLKLHFFTGKWPKIYLTAWSGLIVSGSKGNKHLLTWTTAERKRGWPLDHWERFHFTGIVHRTFIRPSVIVSQRLNKRHWVNSLNSQMQLSFCRIAYVSLLFK